MMERSIITKHLESLNLEYSIVNNRSEFFDFESHRILSNIGYSMNDNEYDSNIQILFSEKDPNNNIFTIICKNPKYVMYSFIFDCLIGDYFDKHKIDFETIKGNYISNKADYSNDIVLGKNNVLGGIPFSFYKVSNIHKRVKSLGRLIIEKGVHFSSNNVVDAGIFTDTVIGANSKIDSNTYIAHDCKIGESTVITSGVSIGGFTIIGENCYIGMNSTIKNGVSIGDNVTIGMGSNVTKSFGDNLIIFGNPAVIVSEK